MSEKINRIPFSRKDTDSAQDKYTILAMVDFTEENILKLFGNEAAENEPIERLKAFYVKGSAYSRVVSDTPLRILVGHKGIGKSALLKVAIAEDSEAGILPILIRPDDIVELAREDKNLLELIRDWKYGLINIYTDRAVQNFGLVGNDLRTKALQSGATFVTWLVDTISSAKDGVSLASTKTILATSFLKTRRIVVYLDDLDRGWEGHQRDIKRISALLNAVRDLSSDVPGLYFRIALRSDVYYLVRTSDESTDKIEGSVVWCNWTIHEILVLLAKRVLTFFNEDVNEVELLKQRPWEVARHLQGVFSELFVGKGHWENAPTYKVLMSLIRKRPRDLVKLCTAAARAAQDRGSAMIETRDLLAVFEDYSQGRIQDTINEYRTELPAIERLLMGMKPSKKERSAKEGYVYSTDALLRKIRDVRQSGSFMWANKRNADEKELAAFMYKINFLTARKDLETGEIVRHYFEESRYLSSKFADFGFDWEIHPAYRWALQPDSLDSVFESLRLSSDTTRS